MLTTFTLQNYFNTIQQPNTFETKAEMPYAITSVAYNIYNLKYSQEYFQPKIDRKNSVQFKYF